MQQPSSQSFSALVMSQLVSLQAEGQLLDPTNLDKECSEADLEDKSADASEAVDQSLEECPKKASSGLVKQPCNYGQKN